MVELSARLSIDSSDPIVLHFSVKENIFLASLIGRKAANLKGLLIAPSPSWPANGKSLGAGRI
jgi:hypothetical protein